MTPTIRLAGGRDAGEIADIYGPIVRDTAISFETDPPTPAEMRDRIDNTIETWPWLVCEHDGAILGYAYASQFSSRPAYRWSVDVSLYVHPDWHRSGVGRGLYESLFALLCRQGFYNAYAGIALPNPASVGLHESMGFERIGVYRNVGYKHGEWHDVGHWGRELQERPASPEPPIPTEDLRETPTWEESVRAGEATIDV